MLVNSLTYLGLYALQHRGQESAGIISSDENILYVHRDMGLVADVFSEETLRKLREQNMKVLAVVVVGKKGFDRRDHGLIAQALKAECGKHIKLFLKTPRQTINVGSIKFVVKDC